MPVKPVPEGLHTLTPQLNLDGCDKAIAWYQRAFGAELRARAPDPSGKKVWHAEMRIGSSAFFLNDTFPEMGAGPSSSSLWIYCENVDQWFKRAVEAGAQVKMPLVDMFWGDRTGTVTDPFGIQWSLAQRIKDMTPAEMQKAQDAFVAEMAKKK